jgi:uncharacterized protein YneF (UPF0154 family)
MRFDIEELESCLRIDKHDLDLAVSRHAELLHHVSKALAFAINDRDLAKKEMEDQYAITTLSIRESNAKSGVKTTEDQIKQMAQIDEDYAESLRVYHAARLKCDKLSALKEAFVARGYMIREMCQLWVSDYFADSAIKADDRNAETVRYELARNAISKKRKPLAKASE